MSAATRTLMIVLSGFPLCDSLAQTNNFQAALANCTRTTQFCEKESYDKSLCESAGNAIPDCDSKLLPGTLCRLKLSNIAPTQIAVGKQQAICKAKEKFEGSTEDTLNYLIKSKHHVPTVIGPKNSQNMEYYITDHHHMSYALYYANQVDKKTDVNFVYACILSNRRGDKTDNFWDYMVENHFTWLNDPSGRAMPPSDLEAKVPALKDLQDDPYRTWSGWVRDSCGYIKAGNDCVPPSYPAQASYFMEFKWADYLQRNLSGASDIGKMTDQEISDKLQQAVAIVQGSQAYLENLPGYSDGTVVKVQYVTIEKGCESED